MNKDKYLQQWGWRKHQRVCGHIWLTAEPNFNKRQPDRLSNLEATICHHALLGEGGEGGACKCTHVRASPGGIAGVIDSLIVPLQPQSAVSPIASISIPNLTV